LARLAGVLSANRVDVVGAVISTFEPASGPTLALDLFHVRDGRGKPIAEDDKRWAAIRRDLAAIEAGRPLSEVLRSRRKRSMLDRRVTLGVATVVEFDQAASERFTVVDVATRN